MSKNNPLRKYTPENRNYRLYKAKKQWITACATVLMALGATAATQVNAQADSNNGNATAPTAEIQTTGATGTSESSSNDGSQSVMSAATHVASSAAHSADQANSASQSSSATQSEGSSAASSAMSVANSNAAKSASPSSTSSSSSDESASVQKVNTNSLIQGQLSTANLAAEEVTSEEDQAPEGYDAMDAIDGAYTVAGADLTNKAANFLKNGQALLKAGATIKWADGDNLNPTMDDGYFSADIVVTYKDGTTQTASTSAYVIQNPLQQKAKSFYYVKSVGNNVNPLTTPDANGHVIYQDGNDNSLLVMGQTNSGDTGDISNVKLLTPLDTSSVGLKWMTVSATVSNYMSGTWGVEGPILSADGDNTITIKLPYVVQTLALKSGKPTDSAGNPLLNVQKTTSSSGVIDPSATNAHDIYWLDDFYQDYDAAYALGMADHVTVSKLADTSNPNQKTFTVKFGDLSNAPTQTFTVNYVSDPTANKIYSFNAPAGSSTTASGDSYSTNYANNRTAIANMMNSNSANILDGVDVTLADGSKASPSQITPTAGSGESSFSSDTIGPINNSSAGVGSGQFVAPVKVIFGATEKDGTPIVWGDQWKAGQSNINFINRVLAWDQKTNNADDDRVDAEGSGWSNGTDAQWDNVATKITVLAPAEKAVDTYTVDVTNGPVTISSDQLSQMVKNPTATANIPNANPILNGNKTWPAGTTFEWINSDGSTGLKIDKAGQIYTGSVKVTLGTISCTVPNFTIISRANVKPLNKTVDYGTKLTAADLVANKDVFPDGTTYNFVNNTEPDWYKAGSYDSVQIQATYPAKGTDSTGKVITQNVTTLVANPHVAINGARIVNIMQGSTVPSIDNVLNLPSGWAGHTASWTTDINSNSTNVGAINIHYNDSGLDQTIKVYVNVIPEQTAKSDLTFTTDGKSTDSSVTDTLANNGNGSFLINNGDQAVSYDGYSASGEQGTQSTYTQGTQTYTPSYIVSGLKANDDGSLVSGAQTATIRVSVPKGTLGAKTDKDGSYYTINSDVTIVQQVHFEFVDDDNGGAQVGKTTTENGVTGQTVNTGLAIPDNYELASGQTLPTTYIFKADDNNNEVAIHLVHKVVTINPSDSTELYGKDKTWLEQNGLLHDVTQTIHYVTGQYRDSSALTDAQKAQLPTDQTRTVEFYKTAQIDLVTGKLIANSISADWQVNGTSSYDALTPKQINGTTAMVNWVDNGVIQSHETQIPAFAPKESDPNSKVTVTYDVVYKIAVYDDEKGSNGQPIGVIGYVTPNYGHDGLSGYLQLSTKWPVGPDTYLGDYVVSQMPTLPSYLTIKGNYGEILKVGADANGLGFPNYSIDESKVNYADLNDKTFTYHIELKRDVTIKYVDADENNAAIPNSDQTVSGYLIGDTMNFNGTGANSVTLKIPTNYVLDTDAGKNPSSYTMTDGTNQTVTIYLKHKIVTDTDPADTQETRTVTTNYVISSDNSMIFINGRDYRINNNQVTIDGQTYTADASGNFTIDGTTYKGGDVVLNGHHYHNGDKVQDSAVLEVYYKRTATKDLATGQIVSHGNWLWDTSRGTHGFRVISGTWTLPTQWGDNVFVDAPSITGFNAPDLNGDGTNKNHVPANEYVNPTFNGKNATNADNNSVAYTDASGLVYEAKAVHDIYYVPQTYEGRTITQHYRYLDEKAQPVAGDDGVAHADEQIEVFFKGTGSRDAKTNAITWSWQYDTDHGDAGTPGVHVISGSWDSLGKADANITNILPVISGYTAVSQDIHASSIGSTNFKGNLKGDSANTAFLDYNHGFVYAPSTTTYYVPNDLLNKTVTRTISYTDPQTGRKQNVTQSYTFNRTARLNNDDSGIVFGVNKDGNFYNFQAGNDLWNNAANVTGGKGSWDAYSVAKTGYTALIDGVVGTEVAAKNDLTADTPDATVNVTYIKNAADVTISGPEIDETYTGSGFTITPDLAKQISNAVGAVDSHLTLPAGSDKVALDNGDFEFVDDNGNTMSTKPTNVGTYHIVLSDAGLKKFQALDPNFTWNYDPKTSYVVFKINKAAPTITFSAIGSKTYDGSNVLNKATFTGAPTISYGTQTGGANVNFQSGDFEFVAADGTTTLAQINATTGAVTGPINAGTYKIQLTAQGLQRIKDANPNFDLSNVTITSVGTGTYTINKYAPVVTIEGSGQKTYDGKAVTSADVTKQDTNNTITIKLTVPKADGSGNETITYQYNYNPNEDYTSDYTWSDQGKALENAPKNAGTYTITLKTSGVQGILNNMLQNDPNFKYLQGNVDNDKAQVSGSATYTIKQKTLTVHLDGNGGKVYDASAATIPTDLASHLHTDGLVTGETLNTDTFDAADYTWYELEKDGTYKSISSPTNVGTYYIGILPQTSTNSGVDTLARDNTNYAITIDYTKHFTYTITPAQGTITLQGNDSATYSGVAHPISGYTLSISGAGVTNKDDQGQLQNGDLEFSADGKTWTTDVPVNAGTYRVRLSQSAQDQLTKAFPNLTLKYVEGTSGTEGTKFTDYVINPSQVTVSFYGTGTKTYDGSPIQIAYTDDNFKSHFATSGVVEGQTLNYQDAASDLFEWVDAKGNVMTTVPTDAGSYTLRLKSDNALTELHKLNPNYDFSFTQNGWNWTIGKATATVNFANNSGSQQTPWTGKATVLDPNNFTVSITTNNGQTLTVPSGSLTAKDFQFYQNGKPIAVPTEIGDYTIGLTPSGLAKVESDTTNYNWVNDASGAYSITKAAAKISLNGSSSTTYTGQAAVIPVDSNGNITGITVTMDNGKTYTLKRGDLEFVQQGTDKDGKPKLIPVSAPTDAGDYLVTLSQSGIDNINNSDDSTHYTYSLNTNANTAKFTIDKAGATIALTGTGSSTYGQTTSLANGAYTIQLPGQSDTTTVDASHLAFVDGVGKVTVAPNDAGTYKVALDPEYRNTLLQKYGNNYKLTFATNASYTINPEAIVIIINGTAQQDYNDKPAQITDVSGINLGWGDRSTTTAPSGITFTPTAVDFKVVEASDGTTVPTDANSQTGAIYNIVLTPEALASLNKQSKNYTFTQQTYARYTIQALQSKLNLVGKQYVDYGSDPMPALNIKAGGFKLTFKDENNKDVNVPIAASDLQVVVPDGAATDKNGLPLNSGQYVVKVSDSFIEQWNKDHPNYQLRLSSQAADKTSTGDSGHEANTNAWYVVRHRAVGFEIDKTPHKIYNGESASIADGDYTIKFTSVKGDENSGVISRDQTTFDGFKLTAKDLEFVQSDPTNAGTYQVRLSAQGLKDLQNFANNTLHGNYDFASVVNTDFTSSSVTGSYVIDPLALTVTLTDKDSKNPSSTTIGDYTLDPSGYTLAITTADGQAVKDAQGNNVNFAYKLQNGDVIYVDGTPHQVGTFKVQLSNEALANIQKIYGTQNYTYTTVNNANHEIAQGNGTITLVGGQTETYTGQPAVFDHSKYEVIVKTDLATSASYLSADDVANLTFYERQKQANGTYTYTAVEGKPTNVGTYYVGLTQKFIDILEGITGNSGKNFDWKYVYAPYKIVAAQGTATANYTNNRDYNGNAIGDLNDIQINLNYPGPTNSPKTYTLQNGDYEFTDQNGKVVAAPTNAGTYNIKLTQQGKDYINQHFGNVADTNGNITSQNVNWTYGTTANPDVVGTYTINPVRVMVAVGGQQATTYNGNEFGANTDGSQAQLTLPTISLSVGDKNITIPTIPTTGPNALTAADFTFTDFSDSSKTVDSPTNAGNYRVYLKQSGYDKLAKLSPNFVYPVATGVTSYGTLIINKANKEINPGVAGGKNFDAQTTGLTTDQFDIYKNAIKKAGMNVGNLTVDGLDWYFDKDKLAYGTQDNPKNPIKDAGTYCLRLNANGQQALDDANPNYNIKMDAFVYYIYPEVVHIGINQGSQNVDWNNQAVAVDPNTFAPTFTVYGGEKGDQLITAPVRDDGQVLTIPAGVNLTAGDYEFVDDDGNVITSFERANGTTTTTPFMVGTYHVRLTESGWKKLATQSTDNVVYQYGDGTMTGLKNPANTIGTLNINQVTPKVTFGGGNWKTYDGNPVSFDQTVYENSDRDKAQLINASFTVNGQTITLPLTANDFRSANGQTLKGAPTDKGTYGISLNKDQFIKDVNAWIKHHPDYKGAIKLLADNISGNATYEIKALSITKLVADPSQGSEPYNGQQAQIDLSTLAGSLEATDAAGSTQNLSSNGLTLADFDIKDADGNTYTDFPINVGTYTFKLNSKGIAALQAANPNFTIPTTVNGYSYEFTVTQAEAKAILSGKANKNYDGQKVTTGEVNGGTSTIAVTIGANKTIYYTLQDGDYDWYDQDGKQITTPTDAGTYTIKLNNAKVLKHLRDKIASDPQWTVKVGNNTITNVTIDDKDLSGSATFTINKVNAQISMSDGTIQRTYNGSQIDKPISDLHGDISATGLIGNDQISTSDLKDTYFDWCDASGNKVDAPTDAGTYYIKLNQTGLDALEKNLTTNYNWTASTNLVKVTVVPAQVSQVINFVDKDNNIIGSQTVTGNVGDSKGTTINFGTGKGQVALNIPTNWKLSNPAPTSTTIGLANQPLNLVIEHQTETIDGKSIPDGGETPDGTKLGQGDFSKDITRTITAKLPDGKTQDLSQKTTLTRNATYDLVTKKVAKWGTWSNGSFAKVAAPTVAGYTPSQASVDADNNVTSNYSDPKIVITYTANDQSITYQFVDDDNKGAKAKTVVVKGKTDQTVNTKLTVPAGYKLAADQTLPTTYTFKASGNDPVTIHLVHSKITVTTDTPKDQVPTGKVPGDSSKTYPTMQNLAAEPTRTITITKPDGTSQTITQKVDFARTATFDEVTGDITYTKWQVAKDSPAQNWANADVPAFAGYTPKITVDGSASAIISIDAVNVNGGTQSTTIAVTYTANDQTGKISYVDDSGKEVGKTNLTGKTDQDITVTPQIPAGWVIVPGQTIPSTVTAGTNGIATVTVKVKHGTITVNPGGTAPTGKVPGDSTKNYQSMDALTKSPTRTITVVSPDGTKNTITQTTKFTRTATFDTVTGEVTYSEWVAVGNRDWAAYTPSAIAGYTPSQDSVKGVTTTADTQDAAVTITYTANTQTGKISYVDENGKEIDTTALTGKTGENVTVTPQIPAGWDEVAGQKVPTTVTAGANGIPTVTITIKHGTITVDPTDPKSPQIPTGPVPGDHNKSYDKVTDSDLTKKITRTITVNVPNSKPITETQTVEFDRTSTFDKVTGKVTYGNWTAKDGQNTWAEYTPKAVAGYVPDTSSIAAVTVDVNKTKDTSVTVNYIANGQTAKIIYVDSNDDNKQVGTQDIGGKVDQTVDINYQVPDNYELDQNAPKTYKFTDSDNQTITVHLKHKMQSATRTQTITETIHYQGAGAKTPSDNVQTITITENGVKDLVTGAVNWTPATGSFNEVASPDIPGYTADQKSIALVTVNFGDKNISKTVTYTANAQTGKISYVDQTGKEISTTDLTGKTDQTVSVTPVAPAGWQIVPGQSIPKTVTATATGVPTVIVQIEHKTITVGPDDTKPTGPLPGDHTKNYPTIKDNDLAKDVTRTIVVTAPNGTRTTTVQKVHFTQTATIDEVTGDITYSGWTVDGNNTWAEFTPTAIAGYKPSQDSVAAVTVDGNTENTEVNISYVKAADAQSAQVIYVDDDNNGAQVGSTQTINGKSGDTVDLNIEVPINYVLVAGQPTTYTFTDGTNQVVKIHLGHRTATIDSHDIPDGGQTPDGQDLTKDDFQKDVKRTITAELPGGKTQNLSQTATLTRQAIYDLVTRKVVSYGAWTTGHFDAVTAPTVAGYTPSQATIPAVASVGSDYVDPNITITYTRQPVNPTNPTTPTTPSQPTSPTTPSQPTSPTTPTNPTGPTTPSQPTSPTTPSQPTSPTTPSQPTGPTTPSQPTSPTTPSQPTSPTTPSRPTSPTTPSRPTSPTTPSQPTSPTTPSQPTSPTTPSQPTGPTTPSQPTGPTTPSQPTGPTTPSQPTSPTTPSRPTSPTTPSRPTSPTTPSQPTSPTTPSQPTSPTTPSQPTSPTTPSQPTSPTTPSRPTRPTTPSQPTSPTTPSQPTGPTTPSQPTRPLNPDNPGENNGSDINNGGNPADNSGNPSMNHGSGANNAPQLPGSNGSTNGLTSGTNGLSANSGSHDNGSQSTASRKLPQTGNTRSRTSVFGFALAGLATLLGLAGMKKKKNDER
ncbi:MBG domain-containing protein [Limosilactobacillus sp.]|uniref:MBG domain-containing protein n=1 Tax=Limosilactobacillus sp. TaxID=2773925 RepID=UPI00345EEA5D